MQTISETVHESKLLSTSHPSPTLHTPFSSFPHQNFNQKNNAQNLPLKENTGSEEEQPKAKVKSEGQITSYEDKRSYIFDWLRRYSGKLKLSWEAGAMTQILSDRYYQEQFYDSK